MNENDELDNVSEVLKESTLTNPELTFCENTTYLDFLLSNAKDEDEANKIKETINDYLDLYNDEHSEEDETTEE